MSGAFKSWRRRGDSTSPMKAADFGWKGVFIPYPENQRLAEKYHVSQDAVSLPSKQMAVILNTLLSATSIATATAKKQEQGMISDQGNITAVYVNWDKVQE